MNPIVGIGEILWDVYPDGRKVAGGAPFNFTFHCHQLGHDAVIVSRVGNDDLGHELRERVRELGLSDEYIQTDPAHPTGTVQVKLDANAVPTYTITENVAWDFIEWDEKLEALAKTCRAVCFGTLAQRANTWDTVQTFLHTQLHQGAWVPLRVFDVNLRQPRPNAQMIRASLARAEWVKLNTDEAPRLAAILGHSSEDLPAFVRSLVCLTTPEQRCAMWTHGENGCDVFAFGENFHEPGVPARVVDTVGAGDAFTAAMVCLHLEGKSLRECARFANHYAARVCEQPGGTPRINRAEVERAAGIAT
jgi:fructokinase